MLIIIPSFRPHKRSLFLIRRSTNSPLLVLTSHLYIHYFHIYSTYIPTHTFHKIKTSSYLMPRVIRVHKQITKNSIFFNFQSFTNLIILKQIHLHNAFHIPQIINFFLIVCKYKCSRIIRITIILPSLTHSLLILNNIIITRYLSNLFKIRNIIRSIIRVLLQMTTHISHLNILITWHLFTHNKSIS